MSERKAVIKNADMTVRAFSQHDPNTRAHECIDYFVIPLHNKSTLLHLFPHLFSWQFESHWCSSIDLVCRTTCSRTQSTAQCTPSTSTTLRRFVLPPYVIRAILHLRACLVLPCRELTYWPMRAALFHTRVRFKYKRSYIPPVQDIAAYIKKEFDKKYNPT